jgi:hypothetical protein
MSFVSTFVTSLIVSVVLWALLLPLLRKGPTAIPNYRGVIVAGSSGILIVISIFITLAIITLESELNFAAGGVLASVEGLLFIILLLGVSFIGLVDDLWGTREYGGFRGHFSSLVRGELTSGLIKAVVGAALALLVSSFFSTKILMLLLNTVLLALTINFFNLLDLRPGRAIKSFLFLSLVTFVATFGFHFWRHWSLILPPVLVVFWGDLNEQSMLGDVGSNLIGAALGYTFVLALSWQFKLAITLLLGLFHWYTENHSLTELIMRVKILRRLDDLGIRHR